MNNIIKYADSIQVIDDAGINYIYAKNAIRMQTAGNKLELYQGNVKLHSIAYNNITLYTDASQYPGSGTSGYANIAALISVILQNRFFEDSAVGGKSSRVSASLSRPNDTTAYASGDAISDSTATPTYLTFSNVASVPGGSGYIVKLRGMTDLKTFTGKVRLHLFHTAPTAVNDNAVYPLLWSNRANRIGQIDLSAFSTEDSTSSTAAHSSNADIRLHYQCASGSRDLYALVESLSAVTPAANQNFFFEISTDNN